METLVSIYILLQRGDILHWFYISSFLFAFFFPHLQQQLRLHFISASRDGVSNFSIERESPLELLICIARAYIYCYYYQSSPGGGGHCKQKPFFVLLQKSKKNTKIFFIYTSETIYFDFTYLYLYRVRASRTCTNYLV